MEQPDKHSTLVFFTGTFPFGKSETVIENEFPYLLKAFRNIIIVSNNQTDPVTRQVPEHVKLKRYRYHTSKFEKLTNSPFLLRKEVREEVDYIHNVLHKRLGRRVLFNLHGSYSNALHAKKFILQLMKQENIKPENLYLYSYWMYDVAIGMAMVKQELPEVKAVCRTHRWDLYYDTNPQHYLPFRNYIINNLDKCFVISEHGTVYLKQMLPAANHQKLKTLRLGTINQLPPKFDLESHVFTVVSCSTLSPQKRVDMIIRALAQLDFKINWIHFGDGALRKEIRAMAHELLGNKTNIQLEFKGMVPNKDIHHYYENNVVDVFLNVSDSEGVPISIMEALSFAIPVVATNAGGTGEIIKHHKNGFLLPVETNDAEVAKALKLFASASATEKTNWRKAAYESWNADFNADKNYRQFIHDLKLL